MTDTTPARMVSEERLTERDVEQLLEKVREFQEMNQKYLITPATPRQEEEVPIINMANTSA